MKPSPFQSHGFVIFFDEERSDMLNMLFNLTQEVLEASKEVGKRVFTPKEQVEFESFIEEAEKHRHAMNWCKDPNCNYSHNQEYNEQE